MVANGYMEKLELELLHFDLKARWRSQWYPLNVVDEGPRWDAPVLIFSTALPESHRTLAGTQIAHFFQGPVRCIAPRPARLFADRFQGAQEVSPPTTPDKADRRYLPAGGCAGDRSFTYCLVHGLGRPSIAWGVALGGQHIRVNRAIIA